MKKYFPISILMFVTTVFMNVAGFSQDIHFSQFIATPLLINPAQTALGGNARMILNYKNQWQSVGSPFRTYAFSGDVALNKSKTHPNYFGMGVLFYSDKAGDSQMGTTEGALTFSGIVKVSDNSKFSGGMLFGFSQRSINYDKLLWENQYDGLTLNSALASNEPAGLKAYHFFDLGGGVCWTYGKEEKYISANDGVRATVGISVWHFGLPRYTFYGISDERLNTKLIMHSAVEMGLANSNVIFAPNLLYMKQGKLHELDLGGIFKFIIKENSKYTGRIKASAIGIGVSYRYKDAIIPQFSYENSAYAFGISYDANISQLKAASEMRGGMEVYIRFATDHLFTSRNSSEAFYN
jgi:type IX secretion system PorP/SprF family membrane protein